MGQVRVADLPTSVVIDKDSYMIVERPGIGDGTFKSKLGDIQEAITVRAKIERNDNTLTITIKDITGETSDSFVIPTAKIRQVGTNTSEIELTDSDGTTSMVFLNAVPVDQEPTQESTNPVASGAVYNMLKRLETAEFNIADLQSHITTLQSDFDKLKDDTKTRLQAIEYTLARTLMLENNQTIPDPFSVNGERFSSLADAITRSRDKDGVVVLFDNAQSPGVTVDTMDDFVLDLNGYTLNITSPGVIPSGLTATGIQIMKDTNATIKNGTIQFNDIQLTRGIQNYSNLILDNVMLTGGQTILRILSNSYGNSIIRNNTKLLAFNGRIAFDVIYGQEEQYDAGVNVTIADNTVQLSGVVEFGKAGRAEAYNFKNRSGITTTTSYMINSWNILNPPCEWIDNGDGTRTFRYAGV